jgi:hypothetical protein
VSEATNAREQVNYCAFIYLFHDVPLNETRIRTFVETFVRSYLKLYVKLPTIPGICSSEENANVYLKPYSSHLTLLRKALSCRQCQEINPPTKAMEAA